MSEITTRPTDAQLKALDELLTTTHRLYGVIDELSGHPMLTEKDHERLDRMFSDANSLDNSTHERLEEAKRMRGIDEMEHVDDYIDL